MKKLKMKKLTALSFVWLSALAISFPVQAIEILATADRVVCYSRELSPHLEGDDGVFGVQVYDRDVVQIKSIAPILANIYAAKCDGILEQAKRLRFEVIIDTSASPESDTFIRLRRPSYCRE